MHRNPITFFFTSSLQFSFGFWVTAKLQFSHWLNQQNLGIILYSIIDKKIFYTAWNQSFQSWRLGQISHQVWIFVANKNKNICDYIPGKNGLILSCNFTRVIDTEKLAGNFQVAKFFSPSSSIHWPLLATHPPICAE